MKKRNMIIAVTAISVLAVTIAALPLISTGSQPLPWSDIIEDEDELREYYKEIEEYEEIQRRIEEQQQAILEQSIREKGLPGNGEEYVGEFEGFSAEQIAQVEKFREEDPAFAGNYLWQEKVILGVVNEDSPRLDLETARAIVAANTEISDIIAEIEKVQAYPDYAGGSGSSRMEYWFDETRENKILVCLDQGGKVYLTYPGLEEYETLFDGFEAWKNSLG